MKKKKLLKIKTILTILVIQLLTITTYTQTQNNHENIEGVKWLNINDIDSLMQKQRRSIIIDIYTDWCSVCKVMDKNTYAHKYIANYINRNFYPIKLNAEKTDSITFFGEKYYKKQYKSTNNRTVTYNELAVKLLNNKFSYPTTIFINTQGTQSNIPGYLKPFEIEPYLYYFAEDLYYFVDLQEFVVNFMFTYPKFFENQIPQIPEKYQPDTSANSNWLTFSQLNDSMKNNPKKIILFSYHDWCKNCIVMKKIMFKNPIIAEYTKKDFYLVDFNIFSKEKINFNGKQYTAEGQNPNKLALEIYKNNIFSPSLIIFDENWKQISNIPGYKTAKNIEPILKKITSAEKK